MWWLAIVLAGEPVVLPASDAEIEIATDAGPAVEAALEALRGARWEEAARQLRALGDAGGGARFRWLEAVARYEGGELRSAERAAAQGLQLEPQHPQLLDLMGLVLTDLGRAEEGRALILRAVDAARTGGDRALEARSMLHLGLGEADRGDYAAARKSWTACQTMATAMGDTALAAEATAQLASLEGKGGDIVGQVSERLGRGDLAGARALASAVTGADARGRARGGLVRAMVFRAEGRLDEAIGALLGVIEASSSTGLLREGVAARLELSRVLHLSGRPKDASKRLEEAIALVAGTSFRVFNVDLHTARGRYALLDEQIELAEAELADARAAAAQVQDPHAKLRLAELDGSIASVRGDLPRASAALKEAASGWEREGFFVEAARVASEGVRVAAAGSLEPGPWIAEAERLFGRAGDKLGPAHVRIALGIGRVKAGDLEGAVRAFAEAGDAARAAGGARLADVADGDAGEALHRMPAERALALARELGIEEVLRTESAWLEAKAAYEAGMKLFQAGKFPEARRSFEAAASGFEAAGQAEQAKSARRSWAWSTYNELTTAEPAVSLPKYDALADTARAVGDDELRLRSEAAAAVAAGRLRRADAPSRLRYVVGEAERVGLKELVGRAYAELSAQELPVGERVDAARAALAWRPDSVGATAMYNVAVAAFNAGDKELCRTLLTEGRPFAGSLSGEFERLLGEL